MCMKETLNEININFEENYNIWANKIIQCLEARDILYTEFMIDRIQRSIRLKVHQYLTEVGYKPKDHKGYRTGLVNRLKKEGLKLTIKSNEILWKYLEYFLDVDDYTKCFDVQIEVDDLVLASKDSIFITT